MTQNSTEELLTTKELASALRKSRSSVYQMVQSKLIPHYKVGQSLRFRLSEVLLSMRSSGENIENMRQKTSEFDSLKTEKQKRSHEFSRKEDLWQK